MNVRLFWMFLLCLAITISPSLARRRRKWSRVYKGRSVTIQKYPYQVIVLSNLGKVCGGSIVSQSYVISAAHCFNNTEPNEVYFVKYGVSNFDDPGTIVLVKDIFRHHQHNWYYVFYDIAVVELKNPIQFSALARPINLRSTEARPGEIGVITGWGITETGNSPNSLQAAELTVISPESCAAYVGYSVTYDMICTREPDRSSCSGDSGGPFVIRGSQVGITSWIAGFERDNCGHSGSVFSSIAYFKDFINSKTKYSVQWN